MERNALVTREPAGGGSSLKTLSPLRARLAMPPLLLDVQPWWILRDPFSALSHLVGALFSIVAAVLLVVRARRRGMSARGLARLLAYGASMCFVFTASTLFHVFIRPPEELVFFKKLDHAAIFIFIAGTSTAFYGPLRVRWAVRLLIGIWLVAGVALVLKMVVWPMGLWVTAAVYLAVGWIAAAGIYRCACRTGWAYVWPFLAGALLFTVGAAVFAAEWPVLWPGVIEGHELFHVFVLAGTAFHFAAVYRYGTHPAPFCPPSEP